MTGVLLSFSSPQVLKDFFVPGRMYRTTYSSSQSQAISVLEEANRMTATTETAVPPRMKMGKLSIIVLEE